MQITDILAQMVGCGLGAVRLCPQVPGQANPERRSAALGRGQSGDGGDQGHAVRSDRIPLVESLSMNSSKSL